MEVAQIRIEKIRFHVVCAVHSVMRKNNLMCSNVSKKLDLGHICLQCEHSLSFQTQTISEFRSQMKKNKPAVIKKDSKCILFIVINSMKCIKHYITYRFPFKVCEFNDKLLIESNI